MNADIEWLARHQEPILEPERRIIDPHHHLWNGRGRSYLLEHIEEDLACGHQVVATVFVECREAYHTDGDKAFRPLGETVFAESVAAASGGRVCTGIVGHVDLRDGEVVKAVLEAHIEVGKGRFRGIRQASAWDPDPGIGTSHYRPPELLLDSEFRKGFAQLAPLGLSFDCWTYFHQIGELVDLARAFPETIIIVNHVGGVLGLNDYANRRDEVFQQWRRSIETLAQCPNVQIKLGGLGMYRCGFHFNEYPVPPSSETLAKHWQPYIDVCLNAFGVSRAMFESNFPVDQFSCSYAVLWNAFKRLAAGCSETEKQALFFDTANRVYRLDV